MRVHNRPNQANLSIPSGLGKKITTIIKSIVLNLRVCAKKNLDHGCKEVCAKMERKVLESTKKRKPVHSKYGFSQTLNNETLFVSAKQLKTSQTKKILFSDTKLTVKSNNQKLLKNYKITLLNKHL